MKIQIEIPADGKYCYKEWENRCYFLQQSMGCVIECIAFAKDWKTVRLDFGDYDKSVGYAKALRCQECLDAEVEEKVILREPERFTKEEIELAKARNKALETGHPQDVAAYQKLKRRHEE